MKSSLPTLEDIRLAMRSKTPREVVKLFEVFIRSVIDEKREDVKAFLIELIEQDDEVLAGDAYSWITHYNDEAVLSFLLNKCIATNDSGRPFYALETVVQKGFFTPQSKDLIIQSMIDLLPKGDPHSCYLPIMRMLADLDAIEAVDLIAKYIEHKYPQVRKWAIPCALRLARSANRRDVVSKVQTHLQDPDRETRLVTAIQLKSLFPEEFSDLEINLGDS